MKKNIFALISVIFFLGQASVPSFAAVNGIKDQYTFGEEGVIVLPKNMVSIETDASSFQVEKLSDSSEYRYIAWKPGITKMQVRHENGFIEEKQLNVSDIKKKVVIDTKSYHLAPGNIYDFTAKLYPGNDEDYFTAKSLDTNIVDVTKLTNNKFRIIGKVNGQTKISVFANGIHAGVISLDVGEGKQYGMKNREEAWVCQNIISSEKIFPKEMKFCSKIEILDGGSGNRQVILDQQVIDQVVKYLLGKKLIYGPVADTSGYAYGIRFYYSNIEGYYEHIFSKSFTKSKDFPLSCGTGSYRFIEEDQVLQYLQNISV